MIQYYRLCEKTTEWDKFEVERKLLKCLRCYFHIIPKNKERQLMSELGITGDCTKRLETIKLCEYPRRPVPRIYANDKGEDYSPRGSYLYPTKTGFCFWCGKQLPKRLRHYCSGKCSYSYYSHFNWNDVREAILIRDNYHCQSCKDQFNYSDLDVDHIKPIHLGGEYWDYSNLQSLCKKCHHDKSGKEMKSYYLKKRRIKHEKKVGMKLTNLIDHLGGT